MDATGASPVGTMAVPAQQLAERFAALRTGWLEIASDIATVGPVNEMLMQRLDGLESLGVAGEHDLLSIAEDAAQVALQVTTAEGARTLSKRLRRAVYEYLLAVDAAASVAAAQASPTVAVVAQPARPGSMMIGLEEVADVQPQPALGSHATARGLDGEEGTSTEADAPPGAIEPPDDDVLTQELSSAGAADAENDHAAERVAEDIQPVFDDGYDSEVASGFEHPAPLPPAAAGAWAAAAAARLHGGAWADAEPSGAGGIQPDQIEEFTTGGAEPEADVHAAGESLPDVDSEEPETEAVGDPDSEVADAAPPAGRPQLTVIHPGYALAAPEPAGTPAPPPERLEPREPAPAAGGAAPPAPAAARDYPPPPAAVVIPSYRAWADVIAAASEPAPVPAPPPEETESLEPDGSQAATAELDAPTPVLGDPDQPLLVEMPLLGPDFENQPGTVVEPHGAAPGNGDWPAVTPEGSPVIGGASTAIGWSVRKSPRQQLLSARMAEKRREQAVRAAQEAISEADKGRKRRDRDHEPLNAGAIPLQVDELIHRKKGAEVANLLQRAAQELEMPELVEVAMSAGDRFRELGQTKVAINCYLAAWRAAPLNEVPLWRLAEACLADHAVDQAVTHLRRIADLMRARGDDDGAVTVYRRIANIAPDNKEVREVLRHLHATGRLLE